MFDPGTLFASLIWGSVGVGYFIYGKKQGSWPPMIGGVVLIAISYFIASPWIMSLLSCVIIAGIHMLLKKGY
jgi:hypothetical protein